MIMIERVRTVGFKGFDLDEDVPQKVIYTGRNKSGKSTRAGAIAIALYGSIPFSTAGKRPGDILDSFGDDHLVVSVTIGGIEFARKFSRNSKGGVTQTFQIDGKRTSAENFAILLNRSGNPRIADVAEFMKQSDAKKTDTLFEIYPNDALSGIDTEIETAKEDISRIEKQKNGAESVVTTLTRSKQAIEIPSGNIAETRAEIKKVESQIADYEEKIKDAEIAEAEIKAKEEGRIEGERLEKERIKKETAQKNIDGGGGVSKEEAQRVIGSMSPGESHEQIMPENNGHAFIDGGYPEIEGRFRSGPGDPVDPIDAMLSKSERQIEAFNDKTGFDSKPKEIQEPFQPDINNHGKFDSVKQAGFNHNPVSSIQRIIDALKGSGCETCAALIVAKQELKKFKEVS